MIFIIKNFASYFSISLLSTLIFIWYLQFKSYPGGAVGMAPLIIIINCIIATSISLTTVQIIKLIVKKELSLIKSNYIFTLVYTLTMFLYFGSNPFENYDNEITKNVVIWSYFSEIITLIIINIILLIIKTSHNN